MSDERPLDSKYRRWLPAMDNLLVVLLSHVVHSFPEDGEPVMTKEAWFYVCNLMRARNPEAVYLTYTKYLCTQHLFNVIQWRYRMWHKLMTHRDDDAKYRYHWNASLGRFQVETGSPAKPIDDTNVVRQLLANREVSLPLLDEFNRNRLPQVLLDMFILDHLRYMLLYHNEVLLLLVRTDYKFQMPEDLAPIPPFDYEEASLPYNQPLKPRRPKKDPKPTSPYDNNDDNGFYRLDRGPEYTPPPEVDTAPNDGSPDIIAQPSPQPSPQPQDTTLHVVSTSKPASYPAVATTTTTNNVVAVPAPLPAIVQTTTPPAVAATTYLPAIKSQILTEGGQGGGQPTTTLEAALTAAAALPPVVDPAGTPLNPTPVFIRDRKWFSKLMDLHRTGHLALGEVHLVCVGVRDGKIPLFMLNVLDQHYYRDAPSPIIQSDEQISYHVRQYMLPMLNF